MGEVKDWEWGKETPSSTKAPKGIQRKHLKFTGYMTWLLSLLKGFIICEYNLYYTTC